MPLKHLLGKNVSIFSRRQELLLIFTYLIWCVLVKCQRFFRTDSFGFNGITALGTLCLTRTGNGFRWSALAWMWPLMHTHANEWKDCWMWLFEVAWLVGLLIIKSRTDLICSLLMFKQLIISNPMTHLLLKWNMFKRSLFYSCIIGLAIYAVRWQLTDFVYSPLIFGAKCGLCFPLNVCIINSNLNSKLLFIV